MERKIKQFTIITPCFNADAYIEETAMSVFSNTAITAGRASVEYIVCDGASTDETLARLENAATTAGSNVFIKIISESDSGVYDALSKGLHAGTGDIYAYLNAGDYYSPHAFDIVLDLFENASIKWLTGMNVKYNEHSHLVQVLVPFMFRNHLIKTGFYGTFLPYIQQESTFWCSELNKMVDIDQLKTFRYAGDYYLWKCFSKAEQLNIVEAWLGGFRHHGGQLSENKGRYRKELLSVAEPSSTKDYLISLIDYFLWHLLPSPLKKSFNKRTFYRYDHAKQTYV